MRKFIHIRLLGFAAFLGVCAAASGQVIVAYNDPQNLAFDAKESFSEFAPAGGTAVTQSGLSIFGGLGTLQLTDPNNSEYSIYNTTTLKWSLGAIGNAHTYGGTQGLGVETLGTNGGPAGIDAALTISGDETYFGGWFQAVQQPGNAASGFVDFTFKDSSNTVVGVKQELITSNSTDGTLIGIGFQFKDGKSFSSVEISGDGMVMDSLRIGKTFGVVPEPASFAPLGLGVLFFMRRKRH